MTSAAVHAPTLLISALAPLGFKLRGDIDAQRVNNATVLAYHDIPTALVRGPSHPATVSFVVNWQPSSQRIKMRDIVNGFAAELVQNTATMAWNASTQGISYFSGPESTSSSVFAYVGHERNGAFFPQGEGSNRENRSEFGVRTIDICYRLWRCECNSCAGQLPARNPRN